MMLLHIHPSPPKISVSCKIFPPKLTFSTFAAELKSPENDVTNPENDVTDSENDVTDSV
jgi:hypothetical protein